MEEPPLRLHRQAVRVSRTPSGNGDVEGSTNKSCIKRKYKRSQNAILNRKAKRLDKRRNGRQLKRNARKELNQVAPDQFSYPKARDYTTAKPNDTDFSEMDRKNTEDCGKGISHFLWREEAAIHRTEIRENEIKYWNALDRKEYEQQEWCIPDKENQRVQSFK